MFSRGVAFGMCVAVLGLGLRGGVAQVGASTPPPAINAANLDDDFAAVSLAVEQCRCPERAKASESLAAIRGRMRQDGPGLGAAHTTSGGTGAGAADQAQGTTTPGTGATPVGGAKGGSEAQLGGTALSGASLATMALAGVALLVSVVALFLWWKLRFRDRRAWEEREQMLRESITADIAAMERRIPKVSPMEAAKGPMRGPKLPPQPGKARGEARPLGALGRGKETGVKETPGVARAETTGAIAQATPQPDPVVSEPTTLSAEMPGRATGDPLTDYAYAKSLGEEEGEDWFAENYKCQRLSCVNLNDHRLGATALYFESAPRGKFLMVEQGDQAGVLPAFGEDFVSARGSLEGVFAYPVEVSGGVALARPARVERTGDRWTLVESGEFRRG